MANKHSCQFSRKRVWKGIEKGVFKGPACKLSKTEQFLYS